MDIPPPRIVPPASPGPAPSAEEADVPEVVHEGEWRGRWRIFRARVGRLFATESGAAPLDPFDVFRSAIFQLFVRVARAFGFLALGVAFGAWALGWTDVNWSEPSDWPTPWKFVRAFESIEDAAGPLFLGAGLYAFSFVGCLRVIWLLPFWMLGFLVQIQWVVRCISDEDEEPWLLPVVVPLVAWQVFACLVGWSEADSSVGWAIPDNASVPGILFLTGFTVCWVSILWIRRWLSREGLTPWELFDRVGYPFNPGLFRWGPPPASAAKPSGPPNPES